jgi:uncharacterized protein
MNTFFDSSAFAKRYIEEAGSAAVEEICLRTTSLALSILCVPEIISAFNRLLREDRLRQNDYVVAKARLMEEIEDVVILNITPNVVRLSVGLIENNVLRTLDALHLACAIEWKADIFVSSDKRQIMAAQKAGMKVRFI